MTFLSQVHDLAQSVVSHVDILSAPPNPGGGEPPPGNIEARITTILKWVAYLASAACVGGLILTGGRMALAYRRGDDTGVGQLGWVLAACVLIGSASGIVGALL